MHWVIVLAILAVVAMAVWNFVPAVRERLRGYTTILDGTALTAFAYPIYEAFGTIVEAMKESGWREWIPNEWQPILLMLFGVWFIIKRVVTKTPVGEAKK